jgi:murein DD-endopeptidase MepM/ murein hydrolase activator NlpD
MQQPLKDFRIVEGGQFGSDPGTYRQFGLVGHHGIDLLASVGTPVYAPEDATVYKSSDGTTDQYTGAAVAGQVIVLKGGYEHWLLHLDKRLVSIGESVKEGQLIGYTGATGFVTGPHLHWGVRPLKPELNNGYRGFIDPTKVMENDMNQPTAAQVKKYAQTFNLGEPFTDKQVQDYTNSDLSRLLSDLLQLQYDRAERLQKRVNNNPGTADYSDLADKAAKYLQIKELLK